MPINTKSLVPPLTIKAPLLAYSLYFVMNNVLLPTPPHRLLYWDFLKMMSLYVVAKILLKFVNIWILCCYLSLRRGFRIIWNISIYWIKDWIKEASSTKQCIWLFSFFTISSVLLFLFLAANSSYFNGGINSAWCLGWHQIWHQELMWLWQVSIHCKTISNHCNSYFHQLQ